VTADGQDDDGGQGLTETELGVDGGGVEAAHLVHGQPVGLGLGDQRRDGLSSVVQGPRLRPPSSPTVRAATRTSALAVPAQAWLPGARAAKSRP
jgi:hypothetical protein